MTVTIIMKSTIGAGIISLPYTISRLGYVLAILLFALIAALTQYSCSLLLKSKNLSKHSNYSTIMQAIWNHKFSKMLGSLLIFLDNMGTCISSLYIQVSLNSLFSKRQFVKFCKIQFQILVYWMNFTQVHY